ncbi:Ubiquitin carboxyl-terminal hydrolase-related protein [Abeliophyllum distichum]|uniref:Ubiquitin carboxyl-terminal hydrolase-related protein n=1 Tax=Abeliophyllum distichum TaxID=126358 RepID=A0ABD1V728_9LAMI
MGDSISGTQIVDTMEKITFTLDDLVLVLDECFLLFKLNSSSCDDAGNDDSSSAYSLPLCYEDDDVVLDSDALSSWIFTGPSNEELLASWSCARKEKAQKGMEILQLREKEFYDLKGLCKKKYERLNYNEALQAVTDLCGEESIKREHVVDHVPQSYDCVLRKRRERLIGSTILSHRVELDAISFVLTNAESTMVRQFGFEETYGGVTSHNLKSGEDDDWRTKDYLHKVDSCIEAAIRRQKDQASLELCRIDARIVRVINWMQQLEVKLDPASAHDFRTILVPLVKSYLRAHLEDLAERDTMKKFDADTEAFLAELALDSENGFVGGGESSSHMHERMKDKKKSKENRRYKDSEATGGNGQHMIRDQTSEEISQISAHDGDDPDAEVFFAGTDVVLRQQEEEYKHRIKLEFEERKVEETLEYERQIENEAKQKHLAEQPVSSEKENDLSTLPIEIEKQEQLRVGKE